MNLHNIIKSEYKNILKESFEYESVDFSKADSMESLYTLIKDNIITSLFSISNIILNLPQERRYDLSSVKNTLQFIESLKEDIDTASELSEQYEENGNFDSLDNLIILADNIYDNLYRLFDNLDSLRININDNFDEFENSVKSYLK